MLHAKTRLTCHIHIDDHDLVIGNHMRCMLLVVLRVGHIGLILNLIDHEILPDGAREIRIQIVRSQ